MLGLVSAEYVFVIYSLNISLTYISTKGRTPPPFGKPSRDYNKTETHLCPTDSGTCYGFSAAIGKTGAAVGTQAFTPIQNHLGKKCVSTPPIPTLVY